MSGSVVYDSGALIAIADIRNRAAADRHRGRLARDVKIHVPAVVAAQVVRRPATQVPLMLTLRGCEVVPFTSDHYLQVGQLLATAETADVVGAFVALLAARIGAGIVTGDPDDLTHLLSCLGVKRPVLSV